MNEKQAAEVERYSEEAPTLAVLNMIIKANAVIETHQKIFVAISGGSDSDILVDLFSRLDPKRKARFVFFNTGLEYEATKRHIKEIEENYGIEIEKVPPILPIPTCCKKYGVPFWSKRVSEMIYRLQKHGFKWEDEPFDVLIQRYPKCRAALRWWCNDFPRKENGQESALNIAYAPYLREYMIENHPPKISAKCCQKAKTGPAAQYEKENCFDLSCTGVRKAEKGSRALAFTSCFSNNSDGADEYRPLFFLSDKDKQAYKEKYQIKNSDCYEVWGLIRTGCCGCPYGKEFEQELELMKKYEPKIYKAAIKIFGDSYEYTRGYLKYREKRKKEEKEKAV